MPDSALTGVPDGVERLGVEGVVRALQNMRLKVALDQCCALMRKWGEERRVTPQRKIVLPEDVEEAITRLTCPEDADLEPACKRTRTGAAPPPQTPSQLLPPLSTEKCPSQEGAAQGKAARLTTGPGDGQGAPQKEAVGLAPQDGAQYMSPPPRLPIGEVGSPDGGAVIAVQDLTQDTPARQPVAKIIGNSPVIATQDLTQATPARQPVAKVTVSAPVVATQDLTQDTPAKQPVAEFTDRGSAPVIAAQDLTQDTPAKQPVAEFTDRGSAPVIAAQDESLPARQPVEEVASINGVTVTGTQDVTQDVPPPARQPAEEVASTESATATDAQDGADQSRAAAITGSAQVTSTVREAVKPPDAKGKRQERQLKAREERERAKREQERKLAEEERLRAERAAPFEGLSIDQMREKRLAEVLAEMDSRMRDIAVRAATTSGGEAPSEQTLEEVCSQAMDVDRREVYMRLIHRVQEDVSMPEGLQAELMPYQVDGLEWLVSIYVNRLHGILADEMGLGKTIQTIAWLQYLKEFKSDKGPHLIVAPKSTLTNWETEFQKFAPSYKVWLVVGVEEERNQLAQKLKKRMKENKTTVYVTNYEQIHRNDWLLEIDWQCIVIDEGHKMKNQKSLLHETMTKMRCRTRMLLTGTPLQNNMNELWALLHYLLPDLFTTTLDFQQWFLEPLKGINGLNEYEVWLQPQDEGQIISRFHTMLAPFLLQRTKAQVMNDRLPPKVESTVRVGLSAWQRKAYSDLEQRTIRLLSSEDKVETHKVNNALMQLRKLVLHPYLFVSAYKPGVDLLRASGKVEALDRMLTKLLRFRHRTLIFSQFTSMLDVLSAFLKWRGHSFVRLDGQTPHEERRARIKAFNSPQGGPQVFLLSSRAGGLGLNLQTADTVILFDLDWNPQNDKQAIARAHRIGQQQEVRVFRLLSASPVELHMEQRCREKLDLEQKIMGAGLFTKGSSQQQRADILRSILGLGQDDGKPAEAAAKPREATTCRQELNRLLARSAEELEAFEAIDQGLLAPGDGWEKGEEEEGLAEGTQSWLVRCGRTMREEEVPEGFRLEEEGDCGAEDNPW